MGIQYSTNWSRKAKKICQSIASNFFRSLAFSAILHAHRIIGNYYQTFINACNGKNVTHFGERAAMCSKCRNADICTSGYEQALTLWFLSAMHLPEVEQAPCIQAFVRTVCAFLLVDKRRLVFLMVMFRDGLFLHATDNTWTGKFTNHNSTFLDLSLFMIWSIWSHF